MKNEVSNAQQSLDCRVEGAAGNGAGGGVGGGVNGNAPLTVGDLFKVECASSSLVLNPSKLKFLTKKPYQLQILKSETQPDGRLQLLVTSYQVGEFKSERLQLTDGVSKADIHGVEFKVESVIDKNNPPKGPYGPYGGYVLPLPGFYFWGLLFLFVFGILILGFKLLRQYQRRRLIQGLKKHDSRLGPQTQLHLRFRQLERQNLAESGQMAKHVAEVEDIFRLFIIRQFKIPAYNWSDRLILNDFEKRFAFLGSEAAKELSVLLRESRKARSLVNPQTKDIEQIVRKIKRWADQVDRATGYGRGVSL
jgi:hypothetical protein